MFKDIIYYKGLLKAMKWKVTELSENFHGELSSPDGGEGIRLAFALCLKTGNTRSRVHSKHDPRTR